MQDGSSQPSRLPVLLSSLTISPTTFGLAILLVATLATVENFPSVENFTMSSVVTMTKKRMKSVSRSTSAISGCAIPNFVEWWDPMCCAVLSSSVSEYEVHLWLVLVEVLQSSLFHNGPAWGFGIVTSHEDRVFIPISLTVRSFVLDVNRGEVVEVLDVSFSPPERHLGSLVYLVVPSSAEYRGMVSTFLCSSFCVCGFCMVSLPLIVSVLSPSSLNSCTVVWSYQGCKSGFNSIHRIMIRSKPDAT